MEMHRDANDVGQVKSSTQTWRFPSENIPWDHRFKIRESYGPNQRTPLEYNQIQFQVRVMMTKK